MIKEAHVGVGINSMSTDKREDSVPMTLSNQEDEEIIITVTCLHDDVFLCGVCRMSGQQHRGQTTGNSAKRCR